MSEIGRSISTGTGAMPPEGPLSRRSLWGWVAVGLVAVGAIGAGAIWATNSGNGKLPDLPWTTVRRGPMTVSITEDGEVTAEKRQVIFNELRWPVIIEELFPEGRVVQKGQTVIRFRCDELLEAIDEQEIRYKSAESAYKAAVTNYDMLKLQLDARVRRAEIAVQDAIADLKKYKEAVWPQLLDDALAKIQLAERDLKLAEHKLQSKLKINADPELNRPYSQNEIDAERLAVDRLKLALKKARRDKEILEKYTHPRKLRDLTLAVEDAKLELVSAKAERDKQLKLAETQRESAALNLKTQRERLEEYKKDRDTKLNVKAEQTGLVVYETRRRPWHRPITVAVGETIKPRQQLIIIPDSSTLVVRTRVYEAVRERVHAGLPAKIRLDARRGKVLRGKVSKVAVLPDSQNPWLSPGVKVYPTTVRFDEDLSGLDLKPGMTCDVEIILAELPDVLSVPIAAVFSDDESTYCYRLDGKGRPKRTAIRIGLTSETRVQVLSGLAEGDRVLLVPPPGEKSRPRRKKKQVQQTATTLPVAMPAGAGTRSMPRRGGRGPLARPRSRPAKAGKRRPATGGTGARRGAARDSSMP